MMYVMAIINKPLVVPISNKFNDLIGPTRPINPKPAESGVPLIFNKPPTKPETPAVQIIGTIIIGWRISVGIINFTAPSNTVIGTPGLFTRQLPTASIIALAETPTAAEPAANPEIPIAKPIPIDDIGETIKIENIIAINTVMIIGCVFVKPLITSPNPNVINLVSIWQD